MLATTRRLAARCAGVSGRLFRVTAPKAFLTPQPAAPLNAPVAMALAPTLTRGMRKESTPSPRCQGRRRRLRLRRTMLPMERARARTLFYTFTGQGP